MKQVPYGMERARRDFKAILWAYQTNRLTQDEYQALVSRLSNLNLDGTLPSNPLSDLQQEQVIGFHREMP